MWAKGIHGWRRDEWRFGQAAGTGMVWMISEWIRGRWWTAADGLYKSEGAQSDWLNAKVWKPLPIFPALGHGEQRGCRGRRMRRKRRKRRRCSERSTSSLVQRCLLLSAYPEIGMMIGKIGGKAKGTQYGWLTRQQMVEYLLDKIQFGVRAERECKESKKL
jgi:hypothetical protein